MKTVAIHHLTDPKRPTVIRADRYDASVHRLWGEDEPRPELPEDVPGRVALIGAGITTLAELEALDDYDSVPGIGEATEERLLAYLDERENG